MTYARIEIASSKYYSAARRAYLPVRVVTDSSRLTASAHRRRRGFANAKAKLPEKFWGLTARWF
jgi:hypothetical protein